MTTVEQNALLARIAELEKQVASKPVGRLSLKVSEKGGLSLYGMGRFPVTLYREQWERVLGAEKEIRAFITANSASLKLKGE